MAAFIKQPLTTIAFCWRIERRDGIALGFTSHDRDLVIDDLPYRAAPGMLPSAIALSDGFAPDTLAIDGALTSDAIREEDLSAGRWDGAEVRVFMIDWRDPGGERLHLARGTLGDVSRSGGGFSAELIGPTAVLDRAVVERTSPECRALLGDKRCRVDLAPRRRITRVTAVADEVVLSLEDGEASANSYAYGRLRWLEGRNSGLESAILSSAGATVTLREPPRFAAAAGDRVELTEGCDKSFATCTGRFGNGANFRGEPHLPGLDLLTRYGSN